MRYYLFFVYLFTTLLLTAQNEYHNSMIDMFWGEEVVSVHKEKHVKVLGKTGLHYFIFTDGKIEKYNQTFELVKSNKIDLTYKKYHQKYEMLLISDQKIYLLTSYINIKLKKKFLFIQQIDTTTLLITGELKKIAEVPVKKVVNEKSFYIISSETKKTHLIFYMLNDHHDINFLVFDQKFKEVWKKEKVSLGKHQIFDIEQLCLDDDYNLHVLGIVHAQKDFKKYKSYRKYFYQISSFFEQGTVCKTNKISFNDYIIINVKMIINKNKNLLITGTYLNKNEKEGVLYLKMNKNSHQIVAKQFNDLPNNFFQEHIYEKTLSRGHPPIFDYVLQNLYIHDNGEMTLVTEQHYVLEEVEHYPPARMMFFYHYHYNDLVLFHYNIQGKLIWNTHINKRQISHNDGGYFLSYASIQTKDNLYFVYNDHHKNYENEQNKIHSFSNVMHHGVIAFAKININTGKMVKDIFPEIKKLDVFIIPKQAHLIHNELIMLGKRGRHHRLVKIIPKVN